MTMPSLARRRPRGFTIIELAAAVILLAVAMTVTVQLLGVIALQRRSVNRRELAVQEVANLMERLAAKPWDEVTPDVAKSMRLSDSAASLPGAELKIAVEQDDAGDTPGRRLSIRLRWRNRAGEFDTPVRLTTWVYQPARRTTP